MDKEALIASVIAKKLDGQANAGELELFQAWLDADPANRVEFARLEKIWSSISTTLSVSPIFDADAAWKKIDPLQVNTADKTFTRSPGMVTSLFRKRIAVAAAVIIFLVGLFGVSYNWSNDTMVAAGDTNKLVRLPDQSSVLLRAGSSLKYSTKFDSEKREVELTGEAFFQVQRNEHQPFSVTTGNSTVTVLGTSFLVRSTDKTDEVVVVTGKVSVRDREQRDNEVLLVAGQRALLQDDVFKQSLVRDSNYIAWKNGILDFKSATLDKVLEDISRYYQTSISLAQPGTGTANIRVTVHFDNQPIDSVLEEIKIITGLETKKEGDKTLFFQK